MSNYVVTSDEDVRRIFPKNKDGKSVPIRIEKYELVLKHKVCGTEVRFSRYLHRGEWLYKDSRDKRSSRNSREIVANVSRMLKIDREQATRVIADHLFPATN